MSTLSIRGPHRKVRAGKVRPLPTHRRYGELFVRTADTLRALIALHREWSEFAAATGYPESQLCSTLAGLAKARKALGKAKVPPHPSEVRS